VLGRGVDLLCFADPGFGPAPPRCPRIFIASNLALGVTFSTVSANQMKAVNSRSST
jgi:hypothetical protein